MEDRAFGDLLSLAQSVADPRRHNRIHNLSEIIVMAILAVLGGAEGWVDVHDFVEDEEPWFRTFLKLSGGIPSHDTFGRIFARLVPSELERIVIGWTDTLREQSQGRLLRARKQITATVDVA
ncbi:MAG: ISAs1 family transposase [Phycisphaerae bacterium]